MKCIVIGKCPQSNGLLFYHPPSKQTLTSATYKFNTFLPAGPQFNLQYDGTFAMTTLMYLENVHIQPTHQQGDTLYFTQNNHKPLAAKVISVHLNDDDEAYVIQSIASGDIFEVKKSELSNSHPSQSTQISNSSETGLYQPKGDYKCM